MSEQGKKEKFYTISARLVFSSLIVLLIVGLVLSLSILINKGPVLLLLGVAGAGTNTSNFGQMNTTTIYPQVGGLAGNTILSGNTIIVEVTCSPTNYTFQCRQPYFNYNTSVFTVALSQNTGYNWIQVTVRFVPVGTVYSHGVPELSWAPPAAVNVTGGLLSNTTKYINIPISNGPIAVGTNITGSIWAKYQLGEGKAQFYANMSSAVIVIKQ